MLMHFGVQHRCILVANLLLTLLAFPMLTGPNLGVIHTSSITTLTL